jgi:hypothetical protein
MGYSDVKAQLDTLDFEERALLFEQLELERKRHELEARRRQVGEVKALSFSESHGLDLSAEETQRQNRKPEASGSSSSSQLTTVGS